VDNNDIKIAVLKEQLANMKKEIEQGEIRTNRELVLAREEIARRLEGLNGEQGRIAQIAADNVSREKFDGHKEEVDRRVGTLEKTQANLAGRFTMLGIVWGIIITIINLYLKSH
jgi:hypothetical protein